MQRYSIWQNQSSLWTFALGLLFSLLFLGFLLLALPVILLIGLTLFAISFFIGRQRVSGFAQQMWQSYRPRQSQSDIYRNSPHVERDGQWRSNGRVFDHQD
ncbi:hypothetical protein JYB87_01090 [Shewanella avicenniae]|uniref:Conjugative transfer region protein, TIGR03750 family n=1 Tax=Shewanella avicenniae TaxID=2814294 RepID=A0ABX7QSA7_9GAMM|nr:hypothetical protein [Shewanella avicenniae]QSX33880.1 hypothetical protein JYB87_01090 [Shewanella avicenniae]